MKPDRADTALLLDILNYARQIRQFVAGVAWPAFEINPEKQAAVMHRITLIGEISRRISEPLKQAHPEIPWSNIAGMRNRLIHDYDDVNLEIVWLVATDRIPELIRQIDPLLPIRSADEDMTP